MSVTRIFVVRHAEAEGNLYRRIHGQYDSRVTVNGLEQIEALQRRFESIAVDACYASDLLRTRTTATAVYRPKSLPLQLDPRFREVRLGIWEDVPFGQLETEQPEQMQKFSGDPLAWGVEGSERFSEYSERFLQAMTEAALQHPGKTIAIFTHGCVIRSMQQRLFFQEEGAGRPGHCDNTGVSLLEFENGTYRAIYLNDNSHLTPELSTLARQRWWKEDGVDHNLWFRPLEDGRRYCQCRREAWAQLYEALPESQARAFYRQAAEAAAQEPEALTEALLGREFAGVVQLDADRHAAEGVGYVSFLYLLPQHRGKGLGSQLLGQAVSFYRARGRSRLWLAVSPRNEAAVRFYRRHGFVENGSAAGRTGPLLRMELPIDLAEQL